MRFRSNIRNTPSEFVRKHRSIIILHAFRNTSGSSSVLYATFWKTQCSSPHDIVVLSYTATLFVVVHSFETRVRPANGISERQQHMFYFFSLVQSNVTYKLGSSNGPNETNKKKYIDKTELYLLFTETSSCSF